MCFLSVLTTNLLVIVVHSLTCQNYRRSFYSTVYEAHYIITYRSKQEHTNKCFIFYMSVSALITVQ